MTNEPGSGEGMLTKEEAAERILEGISRAGAVDLTPPLKKPLIGQEANRSQHLDAAALKQRQEQVALEQSLEEGQALREANPPKAPESPGQKLGRITKGVPR